MLNKENSTLIKSSSRVRSSVIIDKAKIFAITLTNSKNEYKLLLDVINSERLDQIDNLNDYRDQFSSLLRIS